MYFSKHKILKTDEDSKYIKIIDVRKRLGMTNFEIRFGPGPQDGAARHFFKRKFSDNPQFGNFQLNFDFSMA